MPSHSSSRCSSCVAGRFSLSGSATCSNCSVGRFAAATATASCTGCAAGRFSDREGALACTACPLGSFQPASLQSKCQKCSPGTFSNASASLSCTACARAYDSATGAVRCGFAATGYYLTSPSEFRQSAPCPANAKCAGGSQAPVPTRGFWVSRDRYEYTSWVYRCFRATCIGGKANDYCWSSEAFVEAADYDDGGNVLGESSNSSNDFSRCDEHVVQCARGAAGPLCM